ncbi:hypothetical protein C6A37_04645 [Desulfobacteraceae bacterium SEEP-SAG9]|nr:hypothetical protein C6A37_04645 [Desulfobacteraceae bacterium SEEP-SAG9]
MGINIIALLWGFAEVTLFFIEAFRKAPIGAPGDLHHIIVRSIERKTVLKVNRYNQPEIVASLLAGATQAKQKGRKILPIK